MSTWTHHQILRQIQRLTPDEQLQLLADLANMVSQQWKTAQEQHSILELEGLGKDLWQGINTDEYIRQECDSW